MSYLQIGKILEGASGVKKDGAAFSISDELDTTAYVSLGNEVLQIARLCRVEVSDKAVQFVTSKGERFFFPPEQVVGLKFGGLEAKAVRPGAGFR